MKNKIGIYKITNIINGKFYIGSAVNILKRWYRHKNDLRNNIMEFTAEIEVLAIQD